MRKPLLALILLALVLLPVPAGAKGGLGVPSTGTIGTTGWFLSCRSTSSSATSTTFYNGKNLYRTFDCGAGMRPHKGVDILGPSATPGVNPVYASANGTVWTAERGNGFGWRVVLRHGFNVGNNGRWLYTIYGHMGNCTTGASYIAPGIVPGATVTAGQRLGSQGDDGYPSGCVGRVHLHWELRASDSNVSNVFLAAPADPKFYTRLIFRASNPNRVTSVTAGPPAPVT